MQITDIGITEIIPFVNDNFEGVTIAWAANVGFGECEFFREKGGKQWKVDTEHMCTDKNRAFLKMLLNKLADTVEISS